jgi:L-amino acid N-acyltransferase YncA
VTEKKLRLRVKIGQGNLKSLALFESLGFRKTTGEVNYFGEWELRLLNPFHEDWIREGYSELEYVTENNEDMEVA